MTKAIGKDVAGTGVLVNCIAPAVIETPMLAGLSQEHVDYMVERDPARPDGQAEEVAALIALLASDEMTFSTGATFDISGGRGGRLLMAASASASTGTRTADGIVDASPRRSLPRPEARAGDPSTLAHRRLGAARGLGRRRHVRAQPRRTGRGERRVKDVYTLVYERRPARALPQGRRLPADGRAGRADRRPLRLELDVPEPEIGARPRRGRRDRRACTIGNDVSSRDIEGTNPLYLPQAKIYAGACALGPAVLEPGRLVARRSRSGCGSSTADGRELFAGETSTGADAPLVRRAGRLARPRQPRAARQRPAHRHRPRPARTTSRSSPATSSRSTSRHRDAA